VPPPYGVDRAQVRFYSTKNVHIHHHDMGRGRLAQLARASVLHTEGRGFEPLSAHHELIEKTPYELGATSSAG
jgi:hypothetical protein